LEPSIRSIANNQEHKVDDAERKPEKAPEDENSAAESSPQTEMTRGIDQET